MTKASEMDDQRRQRLERATQSLTQRLSPLTFHGSAHEITRLVTGEVRDWAQDAGFTCRAETSSPYLWTTSRGIPHAGRLDLTGVHPCGLRLAIEIDRYDKYGSLAKLINEAEHGPRGPWYQSFRCQPSSGGPTRARAAATAVLSSRVRNEPSRSSHSPPRHRT